MNILDVSAVVLANQCVCYLVTSQNEEAEELLRKLEKEEEQKNLFSLCCSDCQFRFRGKSPITWMDLFVQMSW